MYSLMEQLILLEEILQDAGLTGESMGSNIGLVSKYGMATVYSEQMSDFYTKAVEAINSKVTGKRPLRG